MYVENLDILKKTSVYKLLIHILVYYLLNSHILFEWYVHQIFISLFYDIADTSTSFVRKLPRTKFLFAY